MTFWNIHRSKHYEEAKRFKRNLFYSMYAYMMLERSKGISKIEMNLFQSIVRDCSCRTYSAPCSAEKHIQVPSLSIAGNLNFF